MTADEVLRDVRGFASAGRIEVTRHARERMAQRRVHARDLRHALENASTCTPAAEAGRWRVGGSDLDGDDITAVVALEDGVVVVTVF